MILAPTADRPGPNRRAAEPALAGNFLGAARILISLRHDFNLSAAIIEDAWALIAGDRADPRSR